MSARRSKPDPWATPTAEPADRDHTFREAWWEQVDNDPDIDAGLHHAAYVVSGEARNDGTCVLISHEDLGRRLRASRATAERRTAALRKLGYLTLTERGGRHGDQPMANRYELSLRQIAGSPTPHPGEGLEASQPLTPMRDWAHAAGSPTPHPGEGLVSPREGPNPSNGSPNPSKQGSQPLTQVRDPHVPTYYPHDSDSLRSSGERAAAPPAARRAPRTGSDLELETVEASDDSKTQQAPDSVVQAAFQDQKRLDDEIGLGQLSVDEKTLADGMFSNGAHPNAVRNSIRKSRAISKQEQERDRRRELRRRKEAEQAKLRRCTTCGHLEYHCLAVAARTGDSHKFTAEEAKAS